MLAQSAAETCIRSPDQIAALRQVLEVHVEALILVRCRLGSPNCLQI